MCKKIPKHNILALNERRLTHYVTMVTSDWKLCISYLHILHLGHVHLTLQGIEMYVHMGNVSGC